MPRKAHDLRRGDLVGWSHKATEGIGRVLTINCTTACIEVVEIEDGYERSTGELRTHFKTNLWPMPCPAEIEERGAYLQGQHLDRKLRENSHHNCEPQIREISLHGLRVPR